MQISVEWTGSYPTLCFGRWNIVIDGIKLTGLGNDDFSTYGTYQSWHFEDWSEVFEDNEEGLHFDVWKINPKNKLLESLERHGFEVSDELLFLLYGEIQACDWRSNSCGGCI